MEKSVAGCFSHYNFDVINYSWSSGRRPVFGTPSLVDIKKKIKLIRYNLVERALIFIQVVLDFNPMTP